MEIRLRHIAGSMAVFTLALFTFEIVRWLCEFTVWAAEKIN